MALCRQPNEEEMKKLKTLSQVIKKNKGIITKWKAFILLIPAAAILIFHVFYKNIWAERAMEKGLARIFAATAEVDELRVSLLKGQIMLEGIRVQNKNNPELNLFETGHSEFFMDMGELTRGRFHIQSAVLEGLQFATPRSSSENTWTSPNPGIKKGGENRKENIFSGVSAMASNPVNAAAALLEEKKSELQTPAYLEETNKTLKEFYQKWDERFKVSEKELGLFIKKYRKIAEKGVPSPGSPKAALTAAKEYNGYYQDIQKEKEKVRSLYRQFKKDKEKILAMKSKIQDFMEKDAAYLQSLLEIPDKPELRGLVNEKIREMLRLRFTRYYNIAEKVLPYYKNWKADKAGKNKGKKDKKAKRMTGQTILFPSPQSPRFLLHKAHIDGGSKEKGLFRADLKDIASEPEKWLFPVSFASSWQKEKQNFFLEGAIDLKKNAVNLLEARFKAPGNPVRYEGDFPVPGLEKLEGLLNYTGTALAVKGKENLDIGLNMNLVKVKIKIDSSGAMTEKLLKKTLDTVHEINISSQITMGKKGIETLQVNSDIGQSLAQSLDALWKDLPQIGRKELLTLLEKEMKNQLSSSQQLSATLNALELSPENQIRNLEELEKTFDNKKKELQKEAETQVKEFRQKAESEAKKVLKKAEDHREEASKKANELKEASPLKDVKFPGF